MGFLSFLKNLNLGVGMPHMPTTTSAGSMKTKEFERPEQTNKTALAGDNHEITGVDKVTRIKSDESGSCTSRMDWTFNHPSRKDNVEGNLEEAVSGQRRLANFKGDQGLGNVASSENAGQIECKVNFLGLPIRPGGKECPSYMRTGGCESASRCRFHHPDPTAVVGDNLQDRKNGVPSHHQGPVEQLCGTPRPSENTSNMQTAFLGPFTPNRGVQQNVHWIGNPTTTIPLHPQEMNINDHRKTVLNKDVEYGFSGTELQQFEEYPQRPSEPECQYFMKTGYCKFKSACRYHHPKSKVSSFGLPKGLVSDNYQHRGTVEQMSVTPLPLENCSNGQTAFSGPSSSVPDLFPPKQELRPNAQSNENQTTTIPLHPQEMNINDHRKIVLNKDVEYGFSGTELQQFEEYPQRPSEPECQYFMKTGYCKFKSACRYHHPKSKVSSFGLPKGLVSDNYQHCGTVEQMSVTSLPSENCSNGQTAFSGPSSSVPDLLPPKQELKPNAQWNENQTITNLLHPPEIIKTIDQHQELANKNTAYEFSGGEPQHFDGYPQKPGEPECQHFMKTGYCKFKSACRYHHPKLNLSSLSFSPRAASNNYEKNGPEEQSCEKSLPSENTTNDQTAFLCPSSSKVSGLFTPNLGFQPTIQWNEDQMATSLLDPPEINIDEKGQELANKNTSYEFNDGAKSQQFDEYPQRPGKPDCQYFVKTGCCKFKSTCRFHHPKPNLSDQALPTKPIATSPLNPPPPEIKKKKKDQKLATKDTVQEFNGGVKSQQFDEYPQRPREPERQHFMKTGSSKGKSACGSHHPKSNLSVPARPQKSDKQIICTHYSGSGNCKFGSACRFSHHIEHT